MKASEARRITEISFSTGKNSYINQLYQSIEDAANAGRTYLSVKSPDQNIINSVIKQLEIDGYTIKRTTGHDMRDGEFWDNLNIKW
jgi:hypothetical protein